MNISLLTPKINSYQNYNKYPITTPQQYTKGAKLAPLKQDTVSFGAAKFIRHGNTLKDALVNQFSIENPELIKIARVYYAVLKQVAEDNQAIFKISDNIEHLVKSPESRVSKIIRSGTMKVPDTIRATAYCKNPYDFDNLTKLLDEMAMSGYSVDKAPIKMSKLMKRGYIPTEEESIIMSYITEHKDGEFNKYLAQYFNENGYSIEQIKNLICDLEKLGHTPSKEEFYGLFENLTKKMPDLDIRLSPKMITNEQIKKLPEEYRFCIGEPQDSGYEDIQIRFVRDYEKDKARNMPHELIILFGENYHNAKSRESHFVYDNLRKFKELNAVRYFENEKYDEDTKRAKGYIELIEEMFRGKISKKEFLNGRNKDFMGDKQEIKITFNDDDKTLLKSYIEGLLKELNKPYIKVINKTNKDKRSSLKAALKQDRRTIKEIYDNLLKTIDQYNSGNAFQYPEAKQKIKKKQNKNV